MSGAGVWLSYAAARAATALPLLHYHRYRLLAIAVENMPAMPRGYSVEEESGQSLTSYIDADRDVIRRRFAAGLTPLAARKGGEIVGVTWLTRNAFQEDEVPVRWKAPPGYAWDTGLWIAPDRRLSRAFQALWAGTADWLRARGLSGSASRVADYSEASLRPHYRMGAEDLGSVTIAGIGSLAVATRGSRRLTAGGYTTIRLGELR